jgi:GMP synthase (glutamine-hydrolysing)
MIKEAGIYNEISQAYAALDTNKAIGVMVASSELHIDRR